MAYEATVLRVMIASPGDVLEERNLVRDALHEWNDINSDSSRCVLLPVGWETHSSPELGERAQCLINTHVLKNCDLLVGVFWTRLGTPTGESESGTVEEIKRHLAAGKPAMIYFSNSPVAPQSVDFDQYSAMLEFKSWCKQNGLIADYDNLADFRDKFRKHVQLKMRQSEYIQSVLGRYEANEIDADRFDAESLTAEAKELLVEASKDDGGVIIYIRYMGGQSLETNGRNFTDSSNRRSVARWEAALNQLLSNELVVARGNKGEVFELTDRGYAFADRYKAEVAIA